MRSTPLNLPPPPYQVFSQHGQDAWLWAILDSIGVNNAVAVEFGAKDGYKDSNTALLARDRGFKRVMFDTHNENSAIGLYRQFITAETINEQLAAHGVPCDVDVMSIDVDGMDFWIWRALRGFRPRLVQIEINPNFDGHMSYARVYDPKFVWALDKNYGSSALAMVRLGRNLDYQCVGACGHDLFFVARSELCGKDIAELSCVPPLCMLARPAHHGTLDLSKFVEVPEYPVAWCAPWEEAR